MPETTFRVQWPDGSIERCYSPSLVVRDHLNAGTFYELGDFVQRSRTALETASERVRDRYGFACTSAAAQLARIEHAAARFASHDRPRVLVEAFEELG